MPASNFFDDDDLSDFTGIDEQPTSQDADRKEALFSAYLRAGPSRDIESLAFLKSMHPSIAKEWEREEGWQAKARTYDREQRANEKGLGEAILQEGDKNARHARIFESLHILSCNELDKMVRLSITSDSPVFQLPTLLKAISTLTNLDRLIRDQRIMETNGWSQEDLMQLPQEDLEAIERAAKKRAERESTEG